MNKRQKYGIRKYKMGAASIALGTVIVIGMSETDEAQAAEISTTEVINNTTSEKSDTTNSLNEKLGENIETNEKFEVLSDFKNESTNEKINESLVSNKDENSSNTIVKPSNLVSSENTPREVVVPSSSVKSNMERSYEYSTNNSMDLTIGNNVSEKVKVNSATITSDDSNRVVNPHNAEKVTLKYNWKFEDSIKSGDYFDFFLSENVDTKGISTKRKMPEIRTKDNQNVIAYGEVLSDNKLRYTFTEYVNEKTNLAAELTLNLFFKPSIALNNGHQEVFSTLGNHKVKNDFYVKYLDGVTDYYGMNINGRIDSLDKEASAFSHYIYINPTKYHMGNIEITGSFEKGNPTNGRIPQITIYKYLDNRPLPQSVYSNFNSKDFIDVTKSFNIRIGENGEYYTKFEKLNGETYIIKYDGTYNEKDSNLIFRTVLKGAYVGYPYNTRTLTWDNGVQFYSNNASGGGTDRPIPIFETSMPIYLDYNSTETVSGQSNFDVIEESEDSMDAFTYHNQVVETDEISYPIEVEAKYTTNAIEYDEDTTKGVVTGAISDYTIVEDTMEYITENNLIELEDDHTLPAHITGQAEGSIEEIEENSVIDINDFTMIDGDHGELTGVLEETDENHYIDINEYTMTEGSHGQATGIIEETDEYQHVDILEMTTPIGENGATQGVIEEVEDSNLIEFDEETGNGAISGHVIGAVEEIEDSFYISTLSESGIEQGSNGSDTFVEDTSEDKPSVKTDSPDPIEIVEEIPRENGYTKGMIIEEDTKPPHFASPNMPKEEPQETQNQPKVNSPMDENNVDPKPTPKDKTIKVVEKVRSKSPKKHEEVMPKVKSEPPSSNSIVSNKPNFAPVSSMPVKLNSNKKVTQNQQHHVKQKALPDTGNTSDKNLILMGGLISLLGFSIMRRKKVKQ